MLCSTFCVYHLGLVCWLLCTEQQCPFWPLGCQEWNMAPWRTGGHNAQGSSLVYDPFLHWNCLQTFHKRPHTEDGCAHICGGHGSQHTGKRDWKMYIYQIIWYSTNVHKSSLNLDLDVKHFIFFFKKLLNGQINIKQSFN